MIVTRTLQLLSLCLPLASPITLSSIESMLSPTGFGSAIVYSFTMTTMIQKLGWVMGSTIENAMCALRILGNARCRHDQSSPCDDLWLIHTEVDVNDLGIKSISWARLPSSNLAVSLNRYVFPTSMLAVALSFGCLADMVSRSSPLCYGLAAMRFGFDIAQRLMCGFSMMNLKRYIAGFTLLESRSGFYRYTAMDYGTFVLATPSSLSKRRPYLFRPGTRNLIDTLVHYSFVQSCEFINVTGPLCSTVF